MNEDSSEFCLSWAVVMLLPCIISPSFVSKQLFIVLDVDCFFNNRNSNQKKTIIQNNARCDLIHT